MWPMHPAGGHARVPLQFEAGPGWLCWVLAHHRAWLMGALGTAPLLCPPHFGTCAVGLWMMTFGSLQGPVLPGRALDLGVS